MRDREERRVSRIGRSARSRLASLLRVAVTGLAERAPPCVAAQLGSGRDRCLHPAIESAVAARSDVTRATRDPTARIQRPLVGYLRATGPNADRMPARCRPLMARVTTLPRSRHGDGRSAGLTGFDSMILETHANQDEQRQGDPSGSAPAQPAQCGITHVRAPLCRQPPASPATLGRGLSKDSIAPRKRRLTATAPEETAHRSGRGAGWHDHCSCGPPRDAQQGASRAELILGASNPPPLRENPGVMVHLRLASGWRIRLACGPRREPPVGSAPRKAQCVSLQSRVRQGGHR